MTSDDNHSAHDSPGEANKLRRFWHNADVERILAFHDIESTAAHVKMLAETEIVPHPAANQVLEALGTISKELAAGKSFLAPEHGDVHTAL